MTTVIDKGVRTNISGLSIYALKTIARKLKLPNYPNMQRGELIQAILETDEAEEKYYVFKSIDDFLCSDYSDTENDKYIGNALQSPALPELKEVEGYIHSLKRGGYLVFTPECEIFHASSDLIAKSALKVSPGDLVKAMVMCGTTQSSKIVKEFLQSTPIKFEKEAFKRPSVKFKLGTLSCMFGQRILVTTPPTYDRIKDISTRSQSLKKQDPDTKIFALVIEETPDCIEYLKESGASEVFLGRTNLTLKEQLAISNFVLYKAKHCASEGNNVVLFIDNFSKIIKVFGKCIATEFGKHSTSAIQDIKTMFLSGGDLKNGGSLTIIAYANKPDDGEKRNHAELVQVANRELVVSSK